MTASSLSPGAKAVPAAKATAPEAQMGRKPPGDLGLGPGTEPARQHHTCLCETLGMRQVSGGPAPRSKLGPRGSPVGDRVRHGLDWPPRGATSGIRHAASRHEQRSRPPLAPPALSTQAAPQEAKGHC